MVTYKQSYLQPLRGTGQFLIVSGEISPGTMAWFNWHDEKFKSHSQDDWFCFKAELKPRAGKPLFLGEVDINFGALGEANTKRSYQRLL